MRSHREALALMWDAINFANDSIRVRESKTRAGIRNVPLTARCKTELLRWRKMLGPEFSPFVFPNMWAPARPGKSSEGCWARSLLDLQSPPHVCQSLERRWRFRPLRCSNDRALLSRNLAKILEGHRRVSSRCGPQTGGNAGCARSLAAPFRRRDQLKSPLQM